MYNLQWIGDFGGTDDPCFSWACMPDSVELWMVYERGGPLVIKRKVEIWYSCWNETPLDANHVC